jgi:septum formation protein
MGDGSDVEVDLVSRLHHPIVSHGWGVAVARERRPVLPLHRGEATLPDGSTGRADEMPSPPAASRPGSGISGRRLVAARRRVGRTTGGDRGYGGVMRVCLASTSPARLMLLRQAGISPETMAPDVDEDAVVAAVEAAEGRALSPEEFVLLLARRKAADVAARVAAEDPGFEGIVIGGDSMFVLDGEILGKPCTPEVATARWHAMRGRTGVLHSGHSVFRLSPGSAPVEEHAVAAASVTFAADVTDDEIAAYVATGEPLLVAGAFTVDSLGGPFIERVDGDPSTVVGMSLSTLRRLVRRLGVQWTDTWTSS